MIWDFHCCGETLREIGRVLGQTIMCSVNLPAQAATCAEGTVTRTVRHSHTRITLLGRVWLWRNYIPGQGVTVMPGVELNLSAPVIFAVPAPAAGHDALPPLEVKFTVPVLLAVTVCVVLL